MLESSDWTTTPALRATPPGQEGQSIEIARYVIALTQGTLCFQLQTD
jgi:hypothetical protein